MRLDTIEDIYELSPTQQGILFHSLYAPNTGMYVTQLSCTLQGNINPTALEQAWQLAIKRHTILRTAFQWEGLEKPLQVVYRQVSLTLEQHDWRNLPLTQQHTKLDSYLQQDRQQSFNLAAAPLMRLALIQLTDDIYQFVWSKHHIISDGWSTALVLKQVLDAYTTLSQQQALPTVHSRPFKNYIAWLQRQESSQAEAYWQQTLKGFTAPTSLRVERQVEELPRQGERYHEQQFQLSSSTTAALQSLARQHQLTLNTIVQGAWAILLSRYSGEADIVFGAAVSGRPAELPGSESMVGLLINTLPVRVQVSGEAALIPWLQQLQAQQAQMRQYEYSPLVDVQRWSDLPAGMPLFESIVVFENYPVDATLQQQDQIEIRDIQTFERNNYPLTALVVPGSELVVKLAYDRDRLTKDTITRLQGHLQNLLEGISVNSTQCLADLSLLTAKERHQLLIEWNNTATNYPQQCIHELIEAQAEITPDAIAIEYEHQQLTYQQLNQQANQLARHLQKLGVKPEVLVGLYVERSLWMVIGLLGILKAGGAYVPLDPTYPLERLAYTIADAQVPILLTQQQLVPSLAQTQTQVICLDTDWQEIAQQSIEIPSSATVDSLAYTIYTSGSTGKPKGVQITHRALVNFLTGIRQQLQVSHTDIFLAVTSLSFDIAALEIFLPLIVGGRLVLVSRQVAADGSQLSHQIYQSHATVMQATPATWRLLLNANWQGDRQLKLLCGGEALPQDLATELLNQAAALWNLYGPTETTVWSTACQIQPEDCSIAIGRPIANTQVYLLDAALQPVPIGVPGQLYIGGTGLARGYLNRPALTAEKFIPDLFSNCPTARLYQTGDLARYRPDGKLEFWGRIDHQVKIRGFRVELREIEVVLSRHPGVQQTVVLAREDSQDKHLVAYVVPTPEHPNTTELRQHLRQHLPDYMIPSVFVTLAALPLTPNGKVNRQALPAPDHLRPTLATAYIAPQSQIEQAIANVWQAALSLEKVGIHDNFWDLGGNSLRMFQVFSQLREIFSQNISMVDLFQYPTISSLADYLSQSQSKQPVQSSLEQPQARDAMRQQRQRQRNRRAASQ